jgi:hypothetical protein
MASRFDYPGDFCRAAGPVIFSDHVCCLFERSELQQTLKKPADLQRKAAVEQG